MQEPLFITTFAVLKQIVVALSNCPDKKTILLKTAILDFKVPWGRPKSSLKTTFHSKAVPWGYSIKAIFENFEKAYVTVF